MANPSFAVFLTVTVVLANTVFSALCSSADSLVVWWLGAEELMDAKRANAPGMFADLKSRGPNAQLKLVYTGKRQCTIRGVRVTIEEQSGAPSVTYSVDATGEWYPGKELTIPVHDGRHRRLLTLDEISSDYRRAVVAVEVEDDEVGRATLINSIPGLDLRARQELAVVDEATPPPGIRPWSINRTRALRFVALR